MKNLNFLQVVCHPLQAFTFQFHQEQVAALRHAGFDVQDFAAWSLANEMDFDLAFDLRVRLPELMLQMQFNSSSIHDAKWAAARVELKKLLSRFATYALSMLPEGFTQVVAQRTAAWSLAEVPSKWVRFALDRWESPPAYGSQSRLKRVADAQWATAMAGFAALGVDELSMGELKTLVQSHIAWTLQAFEDGIYLPEIDRFHLLPSDGTGLKRLHDCHFPLAGGFRATPTFERRGQPGEGGEGDFFARMHQGVGDAVSEVSEQAIYESWGQEVERIYSRPRLHVYWRKQWQWARDRADLEKSRPDELKDHLKTLVGKGFLTEPAEREQMRPVVLQLLQSNPSSRARSLAAHQLIANLMTREKRLNTVSVAAAAGSIQVAQATARYVADQHLDVTNPHHRLNITDLYRTYRRMLARGELTTEATVRGWLVEWDRKWGVPFGP